MLKQNVVASYPCWIILVAAVLLQQRCTKCHGFSMLSNQPSSFQRSHHRTPITPTKTQLFGLLEWRAQQLASSSNRSDDEPNSQQQQQQQLVIVEKGTILMLPFRVEEALLPGQSVTVTLKHGRFFDLFQDAMDDHCDILGMVLMDDDGVTKTIVVCEILDFQVDAGFRGKITIHVTLQAVGRALLQELTAWKPIMTGICGEVSDHHDDDHDDDESHGDTIADLQENIQSTLEVLGKQSQFDDAFQHSLSIVSNCTQSNAVFCEPEAASWAALAVADDEFKSGQLLQQFLESTSVLERLQLALKVLLANRFQRAQAETSATRSTSLSASISDADDDKSVFE